IPVADGPHIGAQAAEFIKRATDWAEQLKQMKAQLDAIIGSRNMGKLMNDQSARQTSVLPDVATYMNSFNSIRKNGYSGASQEAKNIYSSITSITGKNCNTDFSIGNAVPLRNCEINAMSSPQNLALLVKSIDASQRRATHIQSLIDAVDGASDQKAALDLSNRINAEITLMQNEKIMMDMALEVSREQRHMNSQMTAEINATGITTRTKKNPFNLNN
ncbi:MAG: type IV secretion system protein, partial [Candidatus Andersenbacteria bacterium]